jgi:hypothetical protein
MTLRNTDDARARREHSRSNSGNRTKGLKRVTFNNSEHDDSELDRADDHESPTFDRNRIASPKPKTAGSIVFVNSQKNIDAKGNRGDVSGRSKMSRLSAPPMLAKKPKELLYLSPAIDKG